MNSDIFDYILITFVVILMLHIIIQLFTRKQTSESMTGFVHENISNKESYAPVKSLDDTFGNVKYATTCQAKMPNTENNVVKPYDVNPNDDKEKQNERQYVNPSPVKNICPVNNTQKETDKYINELVTGSKFKCETNGKKYTNDQIEAFNNSQFNLAETLNRSTSNDMVTPVDKINSMRTSPNSSFINPFEGNKISDYFDELLSNEKITQQKCKYENCLIPPIKDDFSQTEIYVDDIDKKKVFAKYNWRYETDDVNNGGKFYDEIEASDEEFESNMVWTK